MLDSSAGKIFLAGDRGLTQTEWFRSYNTFNFGNYRQESRQPFKNLYLLNDDTLAAGRNIELSVEKDSDLLLVPVVGALSYKDSRANEALVNSGEFQLLSVPGATTVRIGNPHEEGLINYLQLWFINPVKMISQPRALSFDIDAGKNQLIQLFASDRRKCFIGKFSGRQEVTYKIQNANNGVFVFVIQGAFEVQYRLLENRDGLALWDIDGIEIEALSNDAIIMLLEL